ncbi:hypothetical protein RFI_25513 [Reticulomyxa filosa]|uniref:Uncharacterized protein n=1 Tax=Reticulomyxa filosa TaxID=46433 RepID=X6MCY9_RETFI|nr:hypothetical protein RFI_25513 [Reticulomyxa filosa]|eukprot:ETO11863.1 hypothetical protein RFI_25513 [Reticulomyxa filosa]
MKVPDINNYFIFLSFIVLCFFFAQNLAPTTERVYHKGYMSRELSYKIQHLKILNEWIDSTFDETEIIAFPVELLDLITKFSSIGSLAFSEEWSGSEVLIIDAKETSPHKDNKDTKTGDKSAVRFLINRNSHHSTATVSEIVSIEEYTKQLNIKYFSWEFQIIANCRASWSLGFIGYPFNSHNRPISSRKELDDCYLSHFKLFGRLGLDLGNTVVLATRLKAGVATLDRFAFHCDLEKRKCHVVHNDDTYCGVLPIESSQALPDQFVPAVCSRSGNECIVRCIPYNFNIIPKDT